MIYTLTTKRLAYEATRGLLLWMVFMLVGCEVPQEDKQKSVEEDFSITGTWELNELLFLSGQRVEDHWGSE